MYLYMAVSGLAACVVAVHFGRIVVGNARMRNLVIDLGLADRARRHTATNDQPGLMEDVFARLRQTSTALLYRTEQRAWQLESRGFASKPEYEHLLCAIAEVRLLLDNAETLACWCLDTKAEDSPVLLEHPDMAELVAQWRTLCEQCTFATRYLRKNPALIPQEVAA